nr:unnamed protein product [Callosobruchus analis]
MLLLKSRRGKKGRITS